MTKQRLFFICIAGLVSILLFMVARNSSSAETFARLSMQNESTDNNSFTVITYNIRGCRDDAGIADPLAIAKELKPLNGQIIALQEVDNNLPRSQFVDQAKAIATRLGMNYAYVPSSDFVVGSSGQALLSAYPIRSVHAVALPADKEPRALLDAELDVNGRPLHVYSTHLGLNAGERKQQFAALSHYLAANAPADAPYLLLGDFNTPAGDPLYQPLLAQMQAPFFSPASELTSLRSADRPVPNDQIFLSPSLRFLSGFSAEAGPSGHFPIGASITWQT